MLTRCNKIADHTIQPQLTLKTLHALFAQRALFSAINYKY